jgi:hypothetical protein
MVNDVSFLLAGLSQIGLLKKVVESGTWQYSKHKQTGQQLVEYLLGIA